MRPSLALFLAIVSIGGTNAAHAQTALPTSSGFRQSEGVPPPEPLSLQAVTLAEYRAPEANQGAAADEASFYAVDNSAIARYSLTGKLIAKWEDKSGSIRHLNSCYVQKAQLWCANSNYPEVPMGSSIEVFDAETLQHRSSHSLGLMEEGSLTWFSPTEGGFIAGFAHYDERGVTYKDHRFASVVAFDSEWRRVGGWLLPARVTERMAPHAASGGALGPDGRLYLTGHDRPEMYVFEEPRSGPYLVHVATIDLAIEGQAFAFSPADGRTIFAIERGKSIVRHIRLPEIAE